MVPAPACPPIDGSLDPLIGFLDFQAQHNPHEPYAVFPTLNSSKDFSSVSFLDLANATHRMAQRFNQDKLGKEGCVVALLLHTDTIHYVAILLGLLRSGAVVRIPLFVSRVRLFPALMYILH